MAAFPESVDQEALVDTQAHYDEGEEQHRIGECKVGDARHVAIEQELVGHDGQNTDKGDVKSLGQVLNIHPEDGPHE